MEKMSAGSNTISFEDKSLKKNSGIKTLTILLRTPGQMWPDENKILLACM